MATTTNNNAIYNFAVRWLFSTNHKNIPTTTKPSSAKTRFLISKIGKQYFPFIWYETLITRSILKVLGVTAGFQAVVFNRYPGFLIILLVVIVVVYLSVLITNIFETGKNMYYQLNTLFVQNEVKLQNFSYWTIFKTILILYDTLFIIFNIDKHIN